MNFIEQMLEKNVNIVIVNKECDAILKKKWYIGFKDRGMGHGDFAVITKKNLVVVECPTREIADHICKLHNDSLPNRKVKNGT